MFTGIVEELGSVVAIEPDGQGSARLAVRGPLVAADARHGDSIAVSGVCLTVTAPERAEPGTFVVDVMAETFARSSLADLSPGDTVNLERAMPADGRFGGHLVQGHVDGVGHVVDRSPGGRWETVRFAVPARLVRYLAEKGSVAVDGVSLTVIEVDDGGPGREPSFTVGLIPTTLAETTLGHGTPGTAVNLEVDVVAKYVERLTTGEHR
jgi:riboflavin synthase